MVKALVVAVRSCLLASCGASSNGSLNSQASTDSASTTAADDIREIVLLSEISAPPLPEGDATVAGVHLGFGSRIGNSGWVTEGPVLSSGEAWARIAEAFPTTGLWPVEVARTSREGDQ